MSKLRDLFLELEELYDKATTLIEYRGLLYQAESEIRRLHHLHGETYKGKIGEPDLALAQRIRRELAKEE